MATNRNEPLFTLFPINKFPLIRIWNITHPGFIQDLAYTFGSDVSATGWKRGTSDTRKAYGFTYDGLHRLKTAVYNEGGSTNNHYSENVNGYDRNGNILSLSRRGRTIFFRVFHDNNTFTEYEWRQMDGEWGLYDSDNEIYAGSNEYFLSLSKAMSFLMEGRNGSEMVREVAERSERIQISDNRSIKKVNRSNRFIYK